jgi:hypothetical protein
MAKRAAHYTPRVGNDICMYIALGFSLEGALNKVGYLAPTLPMVWRWLSEHDDFREKYELARQMQADTLADKTLDMVKDVLNNPKDASAYRLACDIFKWHAGIRNGKTYNPATNESGQKVVLDANKIKAEIKRLEAELGVQEKKVIKLVANAPKVRADE